MQSKLWEIKSPDMDFTSLCLHVKLGINYYSESLSVHISNFLHNKTYVSKLPCAFVFRCAFDSAKFKVWIFFFACLFFFPVFMNLLVKIYKKRYDRHKETLWTTDFFNSVCCLVSCSPKIKFHILKLWTTNLTRLLLRKKGKKKRI